MAVLAVIFDFDDTLVRDSTSALLKAHGIDPEEFWSTRVKALLDRGYDPPLAYLNLMLQEVGEGKPLGKLTNEKLRDFGRSLDSEWFPGLPAMFEDLRELASGYRDVSLEFYIISGGLQAIIEGSDHVSRYFKGIYGRQLDEDNETGLVRYVKRCVTFHREDTLSIRDNKGISAADAATQPHLVNAMVREDDRAVPIRNMIYVGDGLTDVPCFSLIERGQGMAFGVFQPGQESAKQAFQRFLVTDRVKSMHFPNYSADAELGAILRAAVATSAARIELHSARAL